LRLQQIGTRWESRPITACPRVVVVTDARIPSTAFADAWIQVDGTEDPGFFVRLLDSTRAELLERARRSPEEFFAPLDLRPGHRVLDVGCGTGDFLRLLAPLVVPGSAVGIDLSETMIAEAQRRTSSSSLNVSFRIGNALGWVQPFSATPLF
jgi:cyclopropane fatty-acyl-phospholipid synthase-like methyltransferase